VPIKRGIPIARNIADAIDTKTITYFYNKGFEFSSSTKSNAADCSFNLFDTSRAILTASILISLKLNFPLPDALKSLSPANIISMDSYFI